MNTPELNTRTQAKVGLFPQLGLDGAPVVVVVIKRRFAIQRNGSLLPASGAEIQLVDVPWDKDKLESSIRYPADLCLAKPSTDVVVVGKAMAPGAVPVKELDVQIRVGAVQKQLRVFGLRVWYRGIAGLALSPPQPFTEVPLRWELAHGGLEIRKNPVGCGVAADPEALLHQPGPQLEDPGDLIRSHKSRPAPAGVAALGPHFSPRLEYAGTQDDRWATERMPLRPLDFDPRHFQVAAPGLVTPSPLRGGEPVELVGLSKHGPLKFHLPKVFFHVGAVTRSGVVEHRPVLDTVLLEPNERHLDLTWRSVVPFNKPKNLRAIRVYEKRRVQA